MKIAIVGAGFAGLAAGKHLRTFGHEVTIFEKCPDVGGVWSRTRRYPGLCTQNNKDTYYLSDLRMPASYPEWPSGAQVQAYLEGYAAMFGLTPHLRLRTEVVRADRQVDDGRVRWLLTTHQVDDEAREIDARNSEEFDFLVVANGIFCVPFIPDWPGRAEFEAAGGQVRAPSAVHELAAVRDKHLVVVGYGKSACDVAVSFSAAAASTTVVARELLWKVPRMLLGVINCKHYLLTRLGEALFEYQTPKGLERFLHGKGRPITASMLATLQSLTSRQLGLAGLGLVPNGGFERVARSNASLVTEGFYEKVHQGSMRVVRDASISRLGVRAGAPVAELSTGETIAAEMVVCATGFQQEVPFLSEEVQAAITDDHGNFELFRQILPHEVSGLAFCGYNSSFFSPLSAEAAAIWIGAHLMGELTLPSVAERRRLVAARLRWMERRTEGHHARGTSNVPFSMHNIDEILSDVGLDVSAATKAEQWLTSPQAVDYRDLPQRLIDRHAARTGQRVGAGVDPDGLSESAAKEAVRG